MSLIGPDGKEIKTEVEGPFFWFNKLPNNDPDFSHVNILFKHKKHEYMVVLPMMEVRIQEVKGEKEA